MNDLKIDWALLREQKAWLLSLNNEYADGIVHLLDAVQDQAYEQGVTEEEIFGTYR